VGCAEAQEQACGASSQPKGAGLIWATAYRRLGGHRLGGHRPQVAGNTRVGNLCPPLFYLDSVMAKSKIQRFCFTLNNYTDKEYDDLCNSISSIAVYAIVGKEVGEMGTPHLQGYANLGRTNRKSFVAIKHLVGERAHIEIAKGSDEDNKKYCSKDGSFVEYGEVQQTGKRNDIKECCDKILAGKRILDIANEYPTQFVKYHRGFKELSNAARSRKKRNFKSEVSVLCGPPGTGKSRYCYEDAHNRYGEDEVYYKPRGEWWDGYEGQKAVILDDFYGWIKFDELLKICDRYPYQVPIKGGYVQFVSERIYLTSNAPIVDWYKFEGYNPAAFIRRCEHINAGEKVPEPYQKTVCEELIDKINEPNTCDIDLIDIDLLLNDITECASG